MVAVAPTRRLFRLSRLPPSNLSYTLTLVPFLYPSLPLSPSKLINIGSSHTFSQRRHATSDASGTTSPPSTVNDLPESHLNPAPDDFNNSTFADRAELTLYAGRGGHGCISYKRDAYLPDGPPNGGDGGSGGNIFIQAAHGETSLHKVARQRFVRAGRGTHGQGSSMNGTRGQDIVITVPVGTVVREIERRDPAAEEAIRFQEYRAAVKARKHQIHRMKEAASRQAKLAKKKEEEARLLQHDDFMKQLNEEDDPLEEAEPWESEMSQDAHDRMAQYGNRDQEMDQDEIKDPFRYKWLLRPGMSKTAIDTMQFPELPRRARYFRQPPAPVYLDLSRPTPEPILLATGGIGGLGNTHFTSSTHPRPMFATKGDEAVTMTITLELKLLADVGLVGLPNAGKSTLLRALTNSRARVGSWVFTTLQPNIGTVVLDKYSGRPVVPAMRPLPSATPDTAPDSQDLSADPRTRTHFSVADIPGLIEGAHLDKGLGIAFLRHVERAGVMAFVIDLSAGDATTALKALWREVALYAGMRDEEERLRAASAREEVLDPFQGPVNLTNLTPDHAGASAVTPTMHTVGKPWFVVATKADLPETRENFGALQAYLDAVTAGTEAHPSGVEGAWVKKCAAIPVSAIQGRGMDRIVYWMVDLLRLNI